MGHSLEHLSSEQQFTMKGTILSLLLVCASAIELEDIANVRTGSDGSGRKPKLFFVSSSSTVTTIQTSTFCYVTASPAAPTGLTTCRKKRRSILKEADDFLPEFEPEPSKTSDVEPSMDESVSERQGKFLLYWLTTTSTSTATSFTKTQTIQSVYCTPASASIR